MPKLNFYAFTLLFSSLVANKNQVHVPTQSYWIRDYSVNALGTFLQKLNLIWKNMEKLEFIMLLLQPKKSEEY